MLTQETSESEQAMHNTRLVGLEAVPGQPGNLFKAEIVSVEDRRIETVVLSTEMLRRHFLADFIRLLEDKSF